ncbi:MAG: alpha/beta hydrolase [Burkholderiales bacterium]|nr:alpha/beta hydrolase [Opitutaceae bacterium]
MASSRLAPAFRLPSLGTDYALYVEPPPPAPLTGRSSVAAPAPPWPVVLCLDGDDQFDALRAARADLASERALPPLLLVGIGYGASYQEPANRRGRDYTPVPIEGAPEGGGADAFLDFLVTRLWPELERRYPIDNYTRAVAGHSLGALFALHALFKPAPFFNRVLASAPSIWWGERALLRSVAELRAKQGALPARVFLGVGERDSRSMIEDLDLLEARLDAEPFAGLEIPRARFPRKNHFNSLAPGFRAGLAALFAPE